jgi:hypothetical protein
VPQVTLDSEVRRLDVAEWSTASAREQCKLFVPVKRDDGAICTIRVLRGRFSTTRQLRARAALMLLARVLADCDEPAPLLDDGVEVEPLVDQLLVDPLSAAPAAPPVMRASVAA